MWGHARGPRVRVTSRASDATRYIIGDPACTRRAPGVPGTTRGFSHDPSLGSTRPTGRGVLAGVAWLFGFWLLAFGSWLFAFFGFWLLTFWLFGNWFLANATRPTGSGRGVFLCLWHEWHGRGFGLLSLLVFWLFWLLDFGIWLFGFLAFWQSAFGFLAFCLSGFLAFLAFWASGFFGFFGLLAFWFLVFGFWLLAFGFWLLAFGFWLLANWLLAFWLFGFWLFWLFGFASSEWLFGFCWVGAGMGGPGRPRVRF